MVDNEKLDEEVSHFSNNEFCPNDSRAVDVLYLQSSAYNEPKQKSGVIPFNGSLLILVLGKHHCVLNN